MFRGQQMEIAAWQGSSLATDGHKSAKATPQGPFQFDSVAT